MTNKVSWLSGLIFGRGQAERGPSMPLLWLKWVGGVGVLLYLLWLYLSAAGKPLYWLVMLPGWSLALLSDSLTFGRVLLIALVCYGAVGVLYWGRLGRWFSPPRMRLAGHLVALLLLVAPLLSLRAANLFDDATNYMTWALNLATGQGYTDLGEPVLRRGPVHAALLAVPYSLFPPTPDAGLVTPKLLGLLNLLLIYWLGRLLFSSWAGLLGAALAAGNSMMMFHFFGSHMLDNTLALFVNLSLVTFYLALRQQNYGLFALIGLWQALAVLTKALGVMWVPLPWLFLLLSPKFQQYKNFVGVWVSSTVFLFVFYLWLAYVYYLDNRIVILENGDAPAAIWSLIHVGLGLYLAGGLALIAQSNNVRHFFQTHLTRLYLKRHSLLVSAGGFILGLMLLAPILQTSGRFSTFTPTWTLDYLQVALQPAVSPLGPLMLMAWLITLLLAWRSAPHRLLALALILPLPIYLVLSQRGWQVRNYFGIFLLSYLLLGHYLIWLGQQLSKIGAQLTMRRSVQMISGSLFLAAIGLMLAQTVSVVTAQVTNNRTVWQKYGAQSPYVNLKGQLTTGVVEWITNHLPPGTSLVSGKDSWPRLTYFRLGGEYPIVEAPFKRMNASTLKKYLVSPEADKIIYIQHEIDSFPIFKVWSEKALYHTLLSNQATYLVIGGDHASLLGSLDFFFAHPAFTRVYQTEQGRSGIAILKVDLNQLASCATCPTAIDDWSWYHLESLAKADNWGITSSQLMQLVGGRIVLAYEPFLLNTVERLGIEAVIKQGGIGRDAALYLEMLQDPDLSFAGPEALLIEAYVSLARLYAEAGDSAQALLAMQRAAALNPALTTRYGAEINRWEKDVIAFYTVGAGQKQELLALLKKNLPLLSWEIYRIRGESSPEFFLDDPETVISFFEQYQDKYKRTPDFKPLSRLMGIATIHPEKSELVAGALTTLGDWYNQQPGSEAKLHAMEAYRQVLTLDPFSHSIKDKLAETYVAYGNAYLETYLLNRADTDQTRAARAYLQAAKLAPVNTQVQQAILRAFQTTGDDDIRAALSQVAMSYEAAINQAPDALSNYWELANIYQELGQSDEAIALYLKILERQPDDSSAHYYLGQIYQNQEKLSEALTHYNRALELKPDWFQIYQKQYDLYRHQNDLTNAVAVLHRAANQNPTAAWPHLELGKLYWTQASGKQ